MNKYINGGKETDFPCRILNKLCRYATLKEGAQLLTF